MVGEEDGIHVKHLTNKTDEARADVFDKDESGSWRFRINQTGNVGVCHCYRLRRRLSILRVINHHGGACIPRFAA